MGKDDIVCSNYNIIYVFNIMFYNYDTNLYAYVRCKILIILIVIHPYKFSFSAIK